MVAFCFNNGYVCLGGKPVYEQAISFYMSETCELLECISNGKYITLNKHINVNDKSINMLRAEQSV